MRNKINTVICAGLAALGLAACGGGGDAEERSTAQASGADANALAEHAQDESAAEASRAQIRATAGTPAIGTLALVSSNVAGRARGGSPCAVSATGMLVAFNSTASDVVAADTNAANDVFLKNLRTGAVTRVSTNSAGAQLIGGALCLAMTPDGNSVVLQTAGGSNPYLPPIEPAIFVKNVATGALTRVTPPLNTFPTTAAYLFQSISDDGLRVALIATPTTAYLGGYETAALGPARALVRDLGTGSLTNLSADVQLDLNQGAYEGSLLLSPDGRKLAFSTRINYPALGDNNGKSDVFVLDVATRNVALASSNSGGVQVTISGPPLFNPTLRVIGFLAGGAQLAYEVPGDSSLGAAGAYIKNLNNATSKLVYASGNSSLPVLSFSDDGNLAAFDRAIYPPNAQQIDAVWVRDLRTGAERRVNTTAGGVVGNNQARLARVSRDGSSVVFQSNASNLLTAVRGTYETYIKTISTAASPLPQ